MESSKAAKILLVVGSLLVLVVPYLFTRHLGFIDFSNTGQIGDTIGGITAPFVNLMGAVLVYFALQAQIKANSIIQGQIQEQKQQENEKKNLQYLTELYSHFKDSINSFQTTRKTITTIANNRQKEIEILSGAEAVKEFIQTLWHNNHCPHLKDLHYNRPKYIEFLSVLKICEKLIKRVYSANVTSEDKAFILSLIEHQYDFKIWFMYANHKKDERFIKPSLCEACHQEHPRYPLELFSLIEDIKSLLEKANRNYISAL